MSTPFTLRLPDWFRDLVTRERDRHDCDIGHVIRAALKRIEHKPLTAAEIEAVKLKQGMAALGPEARKSHADSVRATRAAKNKPSKRKSKKI